MSPRVKFLKPRDPWPAERHVAVVAYMSKPIETDLQAYFYDSKDGDHGAYPAADWDLWETIGFARNLATARGVSLLAVRTEREPALSVSAEARKQQLAACGGCT